MRVAFLLIADYTNVTSDGKLNVMGIFDRINVVEFPAKCPFINLVARVVPDVGEDERVCDLTVNLIDPDGEALLSVTIPIEVPEPVDGRSSTVNAMFALGGTEFHKAGRHEFVAWIDGSDSERQIIEIDVVAIQPRDMSGGQ